MFITSRNCEAVLGIPWLRAVHIAESRGIPFINIGPRRRMIPAHEMVRALQGEHEQQHPAQPLTEREEVDAILRARGLERIQ